MIDEGYESPGSLVSASDMPPDFQRPRPNTRSQINSLLASKVPVLTPGVTQVENPDTTNSLPSNFDGPPFQKSAGTSSSTQIDDPDKRFSLAEVQQIIQSMILQMAPKQQDIPPAINIPVPVAPSNKENRVPHAEFKDTTTAQSKQLEPIKLSNSGSSNKKHLKSLKLILDECRLLSLAEGTRLPPRCHERNIFGYTPDTAVRGADGIIRLVAKDDLAKFTHDRERLFSILHICTNEDLHYLVTLHIENKDASKWYLALVEHIHGTTNTDIRKAKKALEDLRITSSKTVKENIALVEEAIKNLNIASNIITSDADKLYYLQEKFLDDKRMPVQGFMATAKSEGLNYVNTVRRLILVDPAIVPVHKMSSLTAKREQCQRFARGVCPDGPNCKYGHDPLPTHGKKAPNQPSKGPPADNRNATYRRSDEKFPRPPFKTPYVITEAQRNRAGTPRGKPSTRNPDGFSIKQMNLIRNTEDTWHDIGHFRQKETEPEEISQPRYNMIQHSDDIESSPRTSSSKAPIKSALLPPSTAYTTVDISQRSAKDDIESQDDDEDDDDNDEYSPDPRPQFSMYRSPAELANDDKIITSLITSHNAQYPGYSDISPCEDLIMWLHNTPLGKSRDDIDPVDIPCFIAFGWMSQYPFIHSTSNCRTDVLGGQPGMVSLLYKINKHYLNADVELPLASAPPSAYMTFDPATEIYFQSGEIGFYQSRMTDIPTYFATLHALAQSAYPQQVKNMLKLGLYFDFMSYVNRTYNMAFKAGLLVQDKRRALLQELFQFRGHPKYRAETYSIQVFSCLISSVGPTPAPRPKLSRASRQITTFKGMTQTDGQLDHWTDMRSPPQQPGGRDTVKTPMKDPTTDISTVQQYRSLLAHPKNLASTNATPPRRGRLYSGLLTSNPRDSSSLSPRSHKVARTSTSPSLYPNVTAPTEFNTLRVIDNKKMLSFSQPKKPLVIIDSGASTSGTGISNQLHNLRAASCTVTAAFGETVQPTHMGDLPPFMLKTIVIPGMKDNTLLSVSQFTASEGKFIGVFTNIDVRFYDLESSMPSLKLLTLEGKEVMRGTVVDGLYIMEST